MGKRARKIIATPIESRLDFFLINYDVVNRKPELLLIHSTVEKQAKRMPDATVETTFAAQTSQIQETLISQNL